MENTERILDWLVSMDMQSYKTEQFPDYKPKGVSHFYLKGSPERFTSKEIIKIFNNNAGNDLHLRWLDAVSDYSRKNK